MTKYEQDRIRCKKIGEDLDQRISELFPDHKRVRVADLLVERTGLKKSTLSNYINDYCNGYLTVMISPARKNPGKKKLIHLERLAMVYDILKIPEDDPIVELTRQVNPNFVYPLPSIDSR